MNGTSKLVWQNVVNALIGVWFIISPFALGYIHSPFRAVTTWIAGLILLIVGGSAALNDTARRQTWLQYVNGLVGVWLILSPSALSYAGKLGDHWTALVGGIVALLLSVYVLYRMARMAAVQELHQH